MRGADAELPHAKAKRGSIHAQSCGGPVGARQNPVGFLEHGEYVCAFGVGQGLRVLFARRRRCRRFQFLDRDTQHRSGRKNYGAFDQVPQILLFRLCAARKIWG